ncbi:unnamed protein product [Alopecurus aequalis]
MADEIPNRDPLPSILLARKPLFTASKNDTTTTATSKAGYLISVSFWLADPPELSLFSIDCSKPQNLQHRKHCNFKSMPRVVAADGPFVLLRVAFFCCRPEYFLYTAKDPPSLHPIPPPDESGDFRARELGILGHRDGDNYLLADLLDAPSSEWDDVYQLRIYSSETKSWSTRRLRNPCPGLDRVIPDKVITLGQGGLLGWVDLSRGLLVCDLLLLLEHQDQDPPVPGAVSYIPLPEPLPGNMYNLKHPIPPTQKWKPSSLEDEPSHSASWFRDLACVNGVLKFVEMENPAPPESKDDIIYDSDLIMSKLNHKASKQQQLLSFRGAWRAVIWTRKVLPPSNFWRQTSSARSAHALTDHHSAFPVIRPDDEGDDIILYVKTVEELSHRDGRVAALDIGNMALRAIGRYYLPHDFYRNPGYHHEHPFRACTLSRHLNMTPGNQVSECHKIIEDSSSANHPSETSDRNPKAIRIGREKQASTKMLLRVLYRMIYFPGPSYLNNLV